VEGSLQVWLSWPIKFTAINKDDELRAQFQEPRTIDQVMQEMSTDVHMDFEVADWIANGMQTGPEMDPARLMSEEKVELKTAGFEWWPEAQGSSAEYWWCRQPGDQQKWFCWGSEIHRKLAPNSRKDRGDKEKEKEKKDKTTGSTGTEPTGGGSSSSAVTQPPAQSGGISVVSS
jgi:hypothetical protein